METKVIFLIIIIVILIGIVAMSALFPAPQKTEQKVSEKTKEMTLPQAPSQNQIFIKEGAFVPSVLNVKKGSTITWINKENQSRQIVSIATDAYDQGEIFRTGQIKSGGQESVVANTVGQFEYFCFENQNIKGQVIVTE